MNARTWLTATALAVAVTSVAPALVDGASAAPAQHGIGASLTIRATAHRTSVHAAGHAAGVGIGGGETLHKVHGKVVHVHHNHKRHPKHG